MSKHLHESIMPEMAATSNGDDTIRDPEEVRAGYYRQGRAVTKGAYHDEVLSAEDVDRSKHNAILAHSQVKVEYNANRSVIINDH